MAFVFGTRNYGYVDRIPGIGFVVTQFFHINFVPLAPTQSFFVVEGSESGNGFRGKVIAMSGKSVWAGYLRGWGWIACAFAAIFCGSSLGYVIGGEGLWGVVGVLIGLLLVAGATGLWNRLWVVAQGLFHVGSFGVWVALAVTSRADGIMSVFTLVANGLLVLYALTRLLDNPGRSRAVELMEEMGYDRETAEEILDERKPRRQPTASDDD